MPRRVPYAASSPLRSNGFAGAHKGTGEGTREGGDGGLAIQPWRQLPVGELTGQLAHLVLSLIHI